jgi:hypothetical protein
MDIEGNIVGYCLPTIEGPEMYVPLNADNVIREVQGYSDGGSIDLDLEVYSYKDLSDGELADCKEYAAKGFGNEALKADVVGHMGKLPAIKSFIGGALFGGLAILTKSPLMGYWGARDLYGGYKYLTKDLKGCDERKQIAEDITLGLEAIDGEDAALREKVEGLGEYFDGLHGTEKEIYQAMEEEAGRLEFTEAKEFYHEKFKTANREKKGFFEAMKNAGQGFMKFVTGNYDLGVEKKTSTFEIHQAPDDISTEKRDELVREVPIYLLPTKEGYSVYVDESPDMYFLLNDRDDANVKLSVRSPVELSDEQMSAITTHFVDYAKDTILMGKTLQHYSEEAQYTKGWKISRIFSDGLGAFFLYRGISGVFSGGLAALEPFQAAIGGNMIASTELIEKQKNKRMAEHTKELIAGVDKLHERIVGAEQVHHAGLEHMEELMLKYDTKEEAYINAFNDASEVGLAPFTALYHRMALAQQWEVSDQDRGIMTIERRDEE